MSSHQSFVLEFSIPNTKISVAPTAVNSSMTVAINFFSTIELTATHPLSSSGVTVGARLPGVILHAACRIERGTLYSQSTYFFAAEAVRAKSLVLFQLDIGGNGKRTDHAADSGGNKLDEVICGVAGFYEDGSTFDDRIDRSETGCFHGFTRF